MNTTLVNTDTLAGAIVKQVDLSRSILFVIGFSLFVAVSAQIAIPLPITPVPLTMQTFAVLMTGALLGPRLGTAAMIAYLIEGASGLPFFSNGHGGLMYMMLSPTAGYLLSYPLAAFVTGWLAEKGWDKKFGTAVLAMLLGSLVILLVGWFWLTTVFGSVATAFTMGVAPFIIGDIVKVLLASALLPSGWALLRMSGSKK